MGSKKEYFDRNGVQTAMNGIGDVFKDVGDAYKVADEKMITDLTTPDGAMYGEGATKFLAAWDENSGTLDDFIKTFDNWSSVVVQVNHHLTTFEGGIYKVNEGNDLGAVAGIARSLHTTALKTSGGIEAFNTAQEKYREKHKNEISYDENGVPYESIKRIENGKIVETKFYKDENGNYYANVENWEWDGEKFVAKNGYYTFSEDEKNAYIAKGENQYQIPDGKQSDEEKFNEFYEKAKEEATPLGGTGDTGGNVDYTEVDLGAFGEVTINGKTYTVSSDEKGNLFITTEDGEKYRVEYDEQGNKTYYKGDDKVEDTSIISELDAAEKGMNRSMDIVRAKAKAGVVETNNGWTNSYSYNEETGEVIIKKKHDLYGEVTFTYKSTYDDEGKEIRREAERIDDQGHHSKCVVEFEYDENDKISGFTENYPDSGYTDTYEIRNGESVRTMREGTATDEEGNEYKYMTEYTEGIDSQGHQTKNYTRRKYEDGTIMMEYYDSWGEPNRQEYYDENDNPNMDVPKKIVEYFEYNGEHYKEVEEHGEKKYYKEKEGSYNTQDDSREYEEIPSDPRTDDRTPAQINRDDAADTTDNRTPTQINRDDAAATTEEAPATDTTEEAGQAADTPAVDGTEAPAEGQQGNGGYTSDKYGAEEADGGSYIEDKYGTKPKSAPAETPATTKEAAPATDTPAVDGSEAPAEGQQGNGDYTSDKYGAEEADGGSYIEDKYGIKPKSAPATAPAEEEEAGTIPVEVPTTTEEAAPATNTAAIDDMTARIGVTEDPVKHPEQALTPPW